MRNKKLKDGDIIVHGLLGQLWYIKEYQDGMIATIISLDSGHGYKEDVEDLGLFLEGNNTEIIGNIHGKRPIQEKYARSKTAKGKEK